MIFPLVQDFADALAAMPREHPRHRMLKLLDEAIRRDVHFIDRHPTTFFQCMWNTCWWYDCPEAELHYEPYPHDVPTEDNAGLTALLAISRRRKEGQTPGFHWVRSLRPPVTPLGSGMRTVLRGHEGAVTDVLYSNDGSQIITGGTDGYVRLWDAISGAELWNRYSGTGDFSVGGLALSPDGLHIAVGVDEGRVLEWDARSGDCRGEFSTATGFAMCVAYSPDGRYFACGDDDGIVRVWHATNRTLVTMFKRERTVTCIAFSRDGQWLVTGGRDGAVQFWDVSGSASSRVLAEGLGKVSVVAFSPDGSQILVAADRAAQVWDPFEGRLLFSLQGHTGAIRAAAYTRNGDRIVTGSEDQTVRIWDACDGSWLGYEAHQEDEVQGVAISPDGRWLAAGGGDMVVRVWDTQSGPASRRLRGHTKTGTPVVFSPDGSIVATGGWDATVCIWNATTGELLFRLQGHEGIIHGVMFSPDGKLLATASADHTVRVWDPCSGTERHCLRGHRDSVSIAHFLAEGARLRSWGNDDTVREWDIESETCLHVEEGQRHFNHDKPKRPSSWDVGAHGEHEVPTETIVAEVPRGLAGCPGVEGVAWFPVPLFWNDLDPVGNRFVGVRGAETYFLTLEGTAIFDPHALDSQPV